MQEQSPTIFAQKSLVNFLHPAAKGVRQKSDEKNDRSIGKSDRKVTQKRNKVIELLLPHSFCGTLIPGPWHEPLFRLTGRMSGRSHRKLCLGNFLANFELSLLPLIRGSNSLACPTFCLLYKHFFLLSSGFSQHAFHEVPSGLCRGTVPGTDGNITRVARNLGFAQQKKMLLFLASFVFFFLCFGQKKGRKKPALNPGTRASLVIVLPPQAPPFSPLPDAPTPLPDAPKMPKNKSKEAYLVPFPKARLHCKALVTKYASQGVQRDRTRDSPS